MTALEPSDPEIAAATFAAHLAQFYEDPRHQRDGWGLVRSGPLVAVAVIPAEVASGDPRPYFVRMVADWYDRYPPRCAFVEPTRGWPEAALGSPHYPALAGSPAVDGHPPYPGTAAFEFALHNRYQYPNGDQRQLLCFSHSFDYYISGHNPQDEQRWTQGVHTLSATLTRLHTVLQAPTYLGSSDVVHT